MDKQPKKINLASILFSMKKINIPINYPNKSKKTRAISYKIVKQKKESNLNNKKQNISFRKIKMFDNAKLTTFPNKKDIKILMNKHTSDKTINTSAKLTDKTLKIYSNINSETGSSKESTSINSFLKNSSIEKTDLKDKINRKKLKLDEIKTINIKLYDLSNNNSNDKDNEILDDSLFNNSKKNTDSKRTKFSNSMSYDKSINNISLEYSCTENGAQSKNKINEDSANTETLEFIEFCNKMDELLFKK